MKSNQRFIVAVFVAVLGVAFATNDAFAQRINSGRKRRPERKQPEPPKPKKPKQSDREVTFDTSDGVKIVADWYPAKVDEGEKAPVAILIHMYPATRSSWKPLVPLLRKRLGISVLAYDIRGTGDSTEPSGRDLKQKYQAMDQAFFADAVKDVEAAHKWLSEQPEADMDRLILIGASVGCSISLEFAAQGHNVKGVACLSPGTDYMGIDSIAHIKAIKDKGTKVLLIAPEGEYAAVESLIEASGDGKYVKGKKYPGGREHHGTRMFDADYGSKVKTRLRKFASGILDLKKKD